MKAILFNAVLLLAAIMEIQPVAAALINVKVDGFELETAFEMSHQRL